MHCLFQITTLEPMITGLQEALPKSIGLIPFDSGVTGRPWHYNYFLKCLSIPLSICCLDANSIQSYWKPLSCLHIIKKHATFL